MGAVVAAALGVGAPARAAVTPDQIALAGFGVPLPPAAQAVLDADEALGQLTYEVRPDYTLVTIKLSAPFPLSALDPNTLVSQLAGLAGVRFAERTALATVQAQPTDPLLGQEDYLDAVGARTAWNVTNGAGVIVGVVDSGVDLTHPDIAAAVGAPGYDFNARNGAVAADGLGHGSEVTGVAAGRGDNGVGIAGVAWGATVVPAKVTDNTGTGTTTDMADGVRYVAASGARVINISMAGDDPSQALEDAIAAANAKGALVVVAAGNQGRDIDSAPAYPASYPDGNILSVGALDGGALADFSNRGAGHVDIAAPGVDLLTDKLGGGFTQASGTSLASPVVAGMAALLAAVHPDWNPGQLRQRLMDAAAVCGRVAGVASGRLCAPAELQAGGTAGGGSGGGGAGGSGGGSGGTGGGSGSSSSSGKLGLARLSVVSRRSGSAYRVTLRWRLTGSRAGLSRLSMKVDSRRAIRLKAAATSVTLRLRRGSHRATLRALDGRGRTLAALVKRFRAGP